MGKLISAAIIVGISSAANAQEPVHSGAYLCRPFGTAGFQQNDQTKEWRATTFNTSDMQYYVKLVAAKDGALHEGVQPDYPIYRLTVKQTSASSGEGDVCDDGRRLSKYGTAPVLDNMAECVIAGGVQVAINFKEMRFQMIGYNGYVYGYDYQSRPYVQIGTCTRLD